MSGESASIFDQFAPTSSPSPALPDSPAQLKTVATGSKPYQAAKVDPAKSRQSRLRIHYLDGMISLASYSYLTECVSTSEAYLSLIFTNSVITLHGNGLTQLIELLQDERIRSLHCFHAGKHSAPAEGQPIITAIERQGLSEVMGEA